MRLLYLFLIFIFLFAACSEDPVPRPRAYFRIDLPEKSYQKVEVDCPFEFEIPEYSRFQLRADHPENCWFNLQFPLNRAQIHFTYKEVDGNLRHLLEESHQLSYEHHVKANDIITTIVSDDSSCVYGLVYRLTGDVASPLQFHLTDSTDHFLRGSLYFDARVNSDSLQPVVEYIAEDVDYLIKTLEWKPSNCQ